MPQCEFCLADHDSDKECSCFKCKCGLHPEFIRRAHVGGKRVALCPICSENHIRMMNGLINVEPVMKGLFVRVGCHLLTRDEAIEVMHRINLIVPDMRNLLDEKKEAATQPPREL